MGMSFEGSATKIVLFRHGEPEINLLNSLKTKCSAKEIKASIRIYNDSGLNTSHLKKRFFVTFGADAGR